jgi:hypothetical protein
MFRFTIRDVLWLTVVVGILFAWRSDRNQIRGAWQNERNQWQAQLDRINIFYRHGPTEHMNPIASPDEN